MIYGCVLLSSSAIAAVPQGTWEEVPLEETLQDNGKIENLVAVIDYPIVRASHFLDYSNNDMEVTYDLDISKIEYIENDVIELGFDPYDYLPDNFDPHSYYFDLNSVAFIEEENHGLGFDSSSYLPLGFDAHKEATDLASIHFMEEEQIALGFDTKKYLPEGFSPYEPYFDINSIQYIPLEESDEDFSILSEVDCKAEEPF